MNNRLRIIKKFTIISTILITFLCINSCSDDKDGKLPQSESQNNEQLEEKVDRVQEEVDEARQKVLQKEEIVNNDSSNEQALKDLQETQRILLEKEQELQAAKEALEEVNKPVACARQVTESEYPCSKVCADISKVHEAFQRYFYCMESNNYAHNIEAKNCWNTYVTEYNQPGGYMGSPVLNSLFAFSQAENMSFASSIVNYTQFYHEDTPDAFGSVVRTGNLLFSSPDGNTRRELCSDFDNSSFDGEDFFKCAKKIMQYYVDENNRRLKCLLH